MVARNDELDFPIDEQREPGKEKGADAAEISKTQVLGLIKGAQPHDDKSQQLWECVWKLAEVERSTGINDKGQPIIMAEHRWILGAIERCTQQSSGGSGASGC